MLRMKVVMALMTVIEALGKRKIGKASTSSLNRRGEGGPIPSNTVVVVSQFRLEHHEANSTTG